MDEFLKIDWNPCLEDLIDDVFIHDERMKTESVMYRLMHGTFVDPFEALDELDIDELASAQQEIGQVKENRFNVGGANKRPREKEEANKVEVKKPLKRPKYVPGIVKIPFRFPRPSELSKEQHALCIRVLLRFSHSEKPEMNETTRKELETYLKLLPTIKKEQEEYLEIAKEHWDSAKFNVINENFINSRWKEKFKIIEKLGKYYSEIGNVAFLADKTTEIKFEETLVTLGCVPRVILPTFVRPFLLSTNSDRLCQSFLFLPESNEGTSSVLHKVPVSLDPNCDILASNANVDLVISSSALNCLAYNVKPSYNSSWMLPITLKTLNGKNVVYIDKPLPATARTVAQKNSWLYKYILKSHLIHTKHPTSVNSETGDKDRKEPVYDEGLFGNLHSDDILKLEEEEFGNLPNRKEEIGKYFTKDAEAGDSDERDTTETSVKEGKEANNDEDLLNRSFNETRVSGARAVGILENTPSSCKNSMDQNAIHPTAKTEGKFLEPSGQRNVTYKLFTINAVANDATQDISTGKIERSYKVLVRSKIDGYEKLANLESQYVMLVPKLEHQMELGAEAVTLEEGIKQWMSLTFRPETVLIRARISATTSEVIQLERRTAMSVHNEIKRLYDVKVEDSLTLLHNVVDELKTMNPGRYLLRHVVRNGPFATIYKEAEGPGKNIFDLHTVYGDSNFYTLPNQSWPMLDKAVITPMLECFERMPAMFYPRRCGRPRKEAKAEKNKPTAAVRKSNRVKKEKTA